MQGNYGVAKWRFDIAILLLIHFVWRGPPPEGLLCDVDVCCWQVTAFCHSFGKQVEIISELGELGERQKLPLPPITLQDRVIHVSRCCYVCSIV